MLTLRDETPLWLLYFLKFLKNPIRIEGILPRCSIKIRRGAYCRCRAPDGE